MTTIGTCSRSCPLLTPRHISVSRSGCHHRAQVEGGGWQGGQHGGLGGDRFVVTVDRWTQKTIGERGGGVLRMDFKIMHLIDYVNTC